MIITIQNISIELHLRRFFPNNGWIMSWKLINLTTGSQGIHSCYINEGESLEVVINSMRDYIQSHSEILFNYNV